MSVQPSKKRPTGLGRGLSALLDEIKTESPVRPVTDFDAGVSPEGVNLVNISDITPHPHQPRRYFDQGALDELASSIKSRGVLQPIVVRTQGAGYEIVAGERRWRAAQRANLHQVPVIVKELDDASTLEIALVENIQRQDLNAIEEAETYQRLINDYGHSQEELGKLVHKSRSHVANLLRLLELPAAVRDAVERNELSMGHARSLLGSGNAEALMQQVLEKGLSVRDTEALVRNQKTPQRPMLERLGRNVNPDIEMLEKNLANLLGIKVKINENGKGGTVTLGYSTLDQLDMVCQRLSGGTI